MVVFSWHSNRFSLFSLSLFVFHRVFLWFNYYIASGILTQTVSEPFQSRFRAVSEQFQVTSGADLHFAPDELEAIVARFSEILGNSRGLDRCRWERGTLNEPFFAVSTRRPSIFAISVK